MFLVLCRVKLLSKCQKHSQIVEVAFQNYPIQQSIFFKLTAIYIKHYTSASV